MKAIVEEKKVYGGLTLHFLPTQKYKTTTIALRFKGKLDQSTVSARALVPYLLQAGCEKYPSNGKIRQQLEMLYGGILSVDVAKKGEYHVVSFVMDIANERFIQHEDSIFEQSLQLLHEVIYNPALEKGTFREKTFDTEKRTMIQRIESVKDDKIRYSNQRLVEEMCAGEPYELNGNGIVEEIKGLSSQRVYDTYKQMLEEDQIDFYVVGDVESNLLQKIETYFPFAPRPDVHVTLKEVKVEKEKEVIEQQPLNQGKLNLGYRTHTTYGDQMYFPLQVFNGIFGGFPHSKLFLNVREKNSLAYYCSSRYESHKGLLMVMSGIETQNYEKAVKIIGEQLELIRQGSFTEEEMKQTKAVIRNQILETLDTSRGLIEMMYHNALANKDLTVEDWVKGVEEVTQEEVVEMAKKIELDTVYFLKGKEA